MKEYRRLAIADRSLLSHNIYGMILRPLGFSLFPHKTFRELRENFSEKWEWKVILVNSNTLQYSPEQSLRWFEEDPFARKAQKIFLCDPNDAKIRSRLKKIDKAHWLEKPFYPHDLVQKLEALFGKV